MKLAVARSKPYDMTEDDEMTSGSLQMSMTTCASDDPRQSTALILESLRPRQIQAATLLVQGQQGRQVAATVGVAEETISRWRQQVAFQNLMHQLLQESIAATKLGMIALTTEAITQLHHLINGFSDTVSLKACGLVLGKIGPVLNVVGSELRQSTVQIGE